MQIWKWSGKTLKKKNNWTNFRRKLFHPFKIKQKDWAHSLNVLQVFIVLSPLGLAILVHERRGVRLWCCKHIPHIPSPPLCSCWAYCEVLILRVVLVPVLVGLLEEPQPRMTVAPLGAETPADLDCTGKGQHMTGNQSASNWMISRHLNMFQLFFSLLPHQWENVEHVSIVALCCVAPLKQKYR